VCTVSFIPVREKYFITSNRDEKYTRKKALLPALYNYNEHKLIFPRDADKGGTWIAMKENGDAAVLLNGAFLQHFSQPFYRMSRGLLLLDVLATDNPSQTLASINLQGIEPFTMVLFEKGCLYEIRWDGNERYCKQLPSHRPHIWSSATLYDGLVINKRERWFASFLNRHPVPTQKDVLNFHRFSGHGDAKNDMLMDREGVYSTVSITSILLTADRGCMKYIDLKRQQEDEIKIELLQPTMP
jgi:hypothetical protein